MAGMRDIKRRIKSVKNTQQITRAMKLVSAAKLRRFQDELNLYRPYNEAHRAMAERVLRSLENEMHHPLLEPNETDTKLVVIMTSDKGLCGSFNQSIIRDVQERLTELGSSVKLFPIGRKGRDFFRKRGYQIWDHALMGTKEDLYLVAQQLGSKLEQAFRKGEFGEIYLASSHFKSALTQRPQFERLLPLTQTTQEEKDAVVTGSYLFEPSAEELLKVLLPVTLNLKLFRALLETTASEHGARMTAMDSATNNATDMIASLTLSYNKARQAAITKELIEVVSGADALK